MTTARAPTPRTTELGAATLPRDILWEIFCMFADMDLDSESECPAVDTLRHFSQVCSPWRNLLMTSPSIWARVVNLIRLERSREWLNEVISRSKTSWLHIKAKVEFQEDNDETSDNFVRLFVTEHWMRMRNLDLIIFLENSPFYEAKEWLSLFNSESNIRHLKLLSTARISNLFPLLFSQAEIIEISDDARCMVPIGGAANLPLLDPEISLPALKALKIKSWWTPSVGGIMDIIKRIKTANGCMLYFQCTVNSLHGNLNLIVDCVSFVLPKYLDFAREAFACKEGVLASILITSNAVDFRLFPRERASDDKEFRFSLQFEDATVVPAPFIPTFISCLESIQPFQDVKALSLVIHVQAPHQSEVAITAVKQTIRTFAFVEVLVIDYPTLYHLESLGETSRGIISFPALKDVSVIRCGHFHDLAKEKLSHLLAQSSIPRIHTSRSSG